MTHPIPKNWQQERLRDLFDFKNGVNAEKKSYGSGIPFINVMEIIKSPALHAQNIPGKISISKEIIEKNIVLKGDVLFNRTSETEDEIALSSVYLDEEPVIFGGFVIRGRPKNEKLTDSYKKYCFRSNAFRSALIKAGQGAVRSNIGQKDLDKIVITFPDKKEQNRITTILDVWDKLIEKLEKKILLKENMQICLARQFLSGKIRLSKSDDKWPMVHAGEVFDNISNKNHPTEPLLSATQEFGVVPRNMLEGRVTMPMGSKSTYKLVEKGDFVISLRSFQGGIEYSYYKGIVSPAYTILRPKKAICDDFYRLYFKSAAFIGRLDAAVFGIRDGKQINYKDFCKVMIPNPSIEEQKEIAKVLVTCEQGISALKKKLLVIKVQRNYLLNHLISGRIRTPENMSIS